MKKLRRNPIAGSEVTVMIEEIGEDSGVSGIVACIKIDEVWHRLREALLAQLEKTYREIILPNFRFSAVYVDGRVTSAFNRYTHHTVKLLSTKLKLVWALLGYRMEECNLEYYLHNEPLTTPSFLALVRANALAKNRNPLPERVVEVERPQVISLSRSDRRDGCN